MRRIWAARRRAGGGGSGRLSSAGFAGRRGRGQGGGNQPLSSGDLDVGLPWEVGGACLVRPEVGDLAKPVLVQQPCYLAGEEPADERLAHRETGEGGAICARCFLKPARCGGWLAGEHEVRCRAGSSTPSPASRRPSRLGRRMSTSKTEPSRQVVPAAEQSRPRPGSRTGRCPRQRLSTISSANRARTHIQRLKASR
jgi:hypothetical protein